MSSPFKFGFTTAATTSSTPTVSTTSSSKPTVNPLTAATFTLDSPQSSTDDKTKKKPGFTFGRLTTAATTSSTPTVSTTSSSKPTVNPLTAATFTLDSPQSSTDDKTKKKPGFTFGLVSEVGVLQLEFPWRQVEWTEEEKKSLLERLSSYTPSSRDVPQARVLLLGPVGSGKSSFISSVQSVLDGRVTTRAMVGRGTTTSFTTKLQSFPLCVRDRGRDGSSALVLCDMMGFGDGSLSGPTLHHMLSVIKGHAPEGCKFRPDEALSSDTEGYVKRPGLRQQMHCVAFVLDASKVLYSSYSERISGTFHTLRRYISDLGIHQVVLLTHIDKICQNTAKDTSEVYRSVCVRDTIYKAAELVGVSPSSVVPVRNYWCELELDLSSDVLLLRALDHILLHTELLLREERDASSSKDKF